MKKHITSEDIEELSSQGRERLREWWIDHIQEGDLYIDLDDPTMFEVIMCCEDELESSEEMPLLSIGQMIEFLSEHVTSYNLDHDNYETWGVLVGEKEYGSKELCAALWEAVKGELEK